MSNGWAKVSDGQCKRVQEACEVGESDIRARDDLSDRYVTHDQNCLCQPWNRRTGKMAPASITREIGFRTDLRSVEEKHIFANNGRGTEEAQGKKPLNSESVMPAHDRICRLGELHGVAL